MRSSAANDAALTNDATPAGTVVAQSPAATQDPAAKRGDFLRGEPLSILIAPSLLAADFTELGAAVAAVERGGADLIHVDVMDGHFVPNITMGPPIVRSLKRVTQLPLDVHLMIQDPDRYIESFVEAGAAWITVHQEVLPHLHRTIHFIHALGARAGVAINPSTPLVAIEEILGDVDHVLVMTVNPGFGGQTFIPRSGLKVAALREVMDRIGSCAPIEVDGGIDLTTAGPMVAAGASILVAGTAIFGADDAERAARELRTAAEGVR